MRRCLQTFSCLQRICMLYPIWYNNIFQFYGICYFCQFCHFPYIILNSINSVISFLLVISVIPSIAVCFVIYVCSSSCFYCLLFLYRSCEVISIHQFSINAISLFLFCHFFHFCHMSVVNLEFFSFQRWKPNF